MCVLSVGGLFAAGQQVHRRFNPAPIHHLYLGGQAAYCHLYFPVAVYHPFGDLAAALENGSGEAVCAL